MKFIVQFGRWRVSIIDEEPLAAYAVTEWLTRDEIEPRNCAEFPTVRAVVEVVRRPLGPSARAMLGGELRHRRGLHIRVGQSSEETPRGLAASVPSALLTPLVPGLPKEFAVVIPATLADVVGQPRLCGELTVDRSAYDEVESSQLVFGEAARFLREVLLARALGKDVEEAVRGAMGI